MGFGSRLWWWWWWWLGGEGFEKGTNDIPHMAPCSPGLVFIKGLEATFERIHSEYRVSLFPVLSFHFLQVDFLGGCRRRAGRGGRCCGRCRWLCLLWSSRFCSLHGCGLRLAKTPALGMAMAPRRPYAVWRDLPFLHLPIFH